jgi:hypothetical protein
VAVYSFTPALRKGAPNNSKGVVVPLPSATVVASIKTVAPTPKSKTALQDAIDVEVYRMQQLCEEWARLVKVGSTASPFLSMSYVDANCA